MDQDPRLELETKAAETPTPEEVRRRSVQDRAEGEARQPFGRGVSYWLTWPVTDPEAMPEWPNAARDARLRDWWWRIPLLGAVVTTFVSRISTLPLKVEADDEDDAAYWRWVLTNADFGRGWKTCIGKFTLDLLCLAGKTRIHLGGDRLGQTKAIAQIVKDKDPGPILSVNQDGNLLEREITEWHKTPLGSRCWWWLSLRYASGHSGDKRGGIFLTEDHPVLTEHGWKLARDIEPSMMVATGDPVPSEEQSELVVGGLLGDMSIGLVRKRALFRFTHSIKQETWLDFKVAALRGFQWTGRNYSRSNPGGYQAESVGLNSRASLGLKEWRERWYPKGKKIVVREDVVRYFSPRMLTVWYCDDGSLHNNKTRAGNPTSPHASLYTNGFVRADVEWLAGFLSGKGIPCNVYPMRKDDKTYWTIHITCKGTRRLAQMIGPYVPPSMRYKLPEDAPAYDPGLWEIESAKVFFDEVIESRQRDYRSGYDICKTTYHIGVAETGNFIAANTVVHNTQDNGSFLEVIRPAKVRGAKGLMPVHRLGPNSYAVKTPDGDYVKLGKLSLKAVSDDPWDTPIGLAHLDSGKCSRRLDPETPVVYNSRKGPRPLKFYQVFDASWMTSSREDDANYGMCPVTLCQIAARITKNIDVYVDEKVGGRYFKRIIWATNVFQENLEQAIKDAEAQADARGQTRYVTNVVVGAADVTSPGEVGVLDLTGLPDGFDRETEYDIAADLITGCFGLDRPEVIPMRTATLGQAGQVGVMALKAKGKGVAEVIALVERFLSNWVLPQDGSVQASLDFKDDEEDARQAKVQKDKADTVNSLCSAPTAETVPPYTRGEVRALHEYYELIPEKMLTPEEAAETPAVEEEGGKKMVDTKARPNRKQCMAADCTSAPVIDVQWADGRGRAWFCLPHFEAWTSETQREIARAWFVEGGEVPKKVKAYDRSAQVRTTGSGVGPKEIVDRIRKFVQKRDRPKAAKAADEPPPNVRGQPLPEEEATEGWEITEEDIAAGQAWVDKAMKEAGFRD